MIETYFCNISPFKGLEDMCTRFGIMNKGIPLRSVNQLKMLNTWLSKFWFWRHYDYICCGKKERKGCLIYLCILIFCGWSRGTFHRQRESLLIVHLPSSTSSSHDVLLILPSFLLRHHSSYPFNTLILDLIARFRANYTFLGSIAGDHAKGTFPQRFLYIRLFSHL